MAKRSASKAPAPLRFDQRLVLNRWLLSLLGTDDFQKLAERLRAPEHEGFTEENITRFHEELTRELFDRPELNRAWLGRDQLLGYDQNIVRHWKQIVERRGESARLYPKYFQYLSLLFTEIYLDRWFGDPERLLKDLNDFLLKHNLENGDSISEYTLPDLSKLAFWSATGSGKTLLMHINILQYQHYVVRYGRQRELNRTILLTPNEGLSAQHLEEFRRSGIQAEIFSKESGSLFSGKNVEIIEMGKIVEEGKVKTVSVEAFENNNLVLIDEGHKGTGGEKWKPYRDMLSSEGFSFEYSATFGQAVSAAAAAKRRALTEEYARAIIFDYSYKHFYRDGYGKDYRILNLADDSDERVRRAYLTASLLSFYQQARLYHDRTADLRRFLLERPLWVFVGGSVNAVRSEGKRQVSDVVDILLFIANYLENNGNESIRLIESIVNGQAGLRDTKGNEIFAHSFSYLQSLKLTPEQIHADVLKLIFNASGPGRLHVELLKGADGEIGLSVGENERFGVINVGDATSLFKMCELQPELLPHESEFAGSLFQTIEKQSTTINLVIGSKKFTEGWNSWRVSTMGLMNMGRSEGSEIIQLFGRGVRLKGYGYSLKRSNRLGLDVKPPEYINVAETLNIFGVRADYMKQFKEYLEDEGLPTNENRIEFILPTIATSGRPRLRTLKLKTGIDFKRTGPKPTIDLPPVDEDIAVSLDLYPKIETTISDGADGIKRSVEKNEGCLEADHLAFVDMEAIYFELQQLKAERGWFNMNISKEKIVELLGNPKWYKLYIPPEELTFRSFAQVSRWQEIAIMLLKKYADAYYKQRKKGYEMGHMIYDDLPEADANMVESYTFELDEADNEMLAKLMELKEAIEAGTLKDLEWVNFRSIAFGRHLYQPLIFLGRGTVSVSPVALNEGERDFLLDLRDYYDKHPSFFEGRELYLLRNQSKGRGLGFFEAGNFYPDFILWLMTGNRQHITFVDPKGIRNLMGLDDPKIRFHKTIKELQDRLADPNVILESFIISNTRHTEIEWWAPEMSMQDMEDRHLLFQKEDKSKYIEKMMKRIVANGMTASSTSTEVAT